MNSNLTLTNSSVGILPDLEVFLRSIPSHVNIDELPLDTLRVLVYFLAKAGPYTIAVENNSFNGTLEEWLRDLKSNLSFRDIVPTYSNLATLPNSIPNLKLGDLVFVSDTSYAYIYNGTNFGTIEDGFPIRGPSNYELAKIEQGFVGTAQDYLNSLKGQDGINGTNGTNGIQGPQGIQGIQGEIGPIGPQGPQGIQGIPGVNGTNGINGNNGKSAYQLYLDVVEGQPLSLGAWLDSLRGEDGIDGDIGPQGIRGEDGLSAYALYLEYCSNNEIEALSMPDWLESLKGFSAYDLYVNEGDWNIKPYSLEEWLDSLVGKSAYQSYLDTTSDVELLDEEAWTLSLKGDKGDKGDRGDPELEKVWISVFGKYTSNANQPEFVVNLNNNIYDHLSNDPEDTLIGTIIPPAEIYLESSNIHRMSFQPYWDNDYTVTMRGNFAFLSQSDVENNIQPNYEYTEVHLETYGNTTRISTLTNIEGNNSRLYIAPYLPVTFNFNPASESSSIGEKSIAITLLAYVSTYNTVEPVEPVEPQIPLG